MDPRTTGLAEVLRTLQRILSSPDLAVSEYLEPLSEDGATTTNRFPVLPREMPAVPLARLDRTLPAASLSHAEDGKNDDDTLASLAEHFTTRILPYLNLSSLSPNYYGFVTGGATPAALLGEFLSSVYDQNVQVHLPRETMATTLEVATLNLLVELFRLPDAEWGIGQRSSGGGGTFTTGATASNVLGLALGREFVLRRALQRRGIPNGGDLSCGEQGVAELMHQAGLRKIQVLSTLPHSSIAKAASIVGIGRKNVISVSSPEGDGLQIDIKRLGVEAARPDVANILAISAGEVNTGRFATDSFDQMTRLRRICDEFGIWIHVDGAFGLFGRVFPSDDNYDGNAEFDAVIRGVAGLELADSITGDCHKLLNVPYDCGVFFTRHKTLCEDVFRNGNAAYLTSATAPASTLPGNADAGGDAYDAIQSPLNIGIENSRRFRALPVYATLVAYGRAGYLDMLKRQIRLARRVSSWLLRDERFDLLPMQSGGEIEQDTLVRTFIVVLFRLKDESLMRTFVSRVNHTGLIYMTGTVWDGKPAARIAISNWKVDLERDGKLIEEVLDEVAGGRR
ncbi:hypothetical protein AYL99_01261 [Fonsecaea erecta]|uniref:Tyrosine decarboxylase n=1 Tax=Fonsecaea erecta TaxID=1367422 RepID=A0A178ZZT2_9EURO|nr:hypothetical protein AYL99_01261 [Fonsecaea erecta]OAP65289.1 hypothetical protein AYL99_01261 [Fonsecaea erecta]